MIGNTMRWFFLLFLFSFPAFSQPILCPPGYKCILEEDAKEIVPVLELHNCMIDAAESNDIDVRWEHNEIVVSKDGQIFAKEDTVAHMTWCSWELELRGKTDIVVAKSDQFVEEWGFRLRVKLGLVVLPTRYSDDFKSVLDPVLVAEPFFYHDFHIQLYGGLSSLGVALGVDITRNADIFVGVGMGFKSVDVVPSIGVSLSFM